MDKLKDPQFPFEEPRDKAADMYHDGYSYRQVLFHVAMAWREQFDRELTWNEIDEIKHMSHEY